MPRIRQYADQYAERDFWREVQSRKALVGMKTDKELAAAMGLSGSSFCQRKKHSDMITLPELRLLVKAVKPDPVVMLKMLGYTQKEIQKQVKMEGVG